MTGLRKESLREDLISYENFIERKATNFELINFFFHGVSKNYYTDISQKKISYVLQGNIDQFFMTEMRQMKTDDWSHFNILPQLMVSWIYNWLNKHNLSDRVHIISFKDSAQLKVKIDEFMKIHNVDKLVDIEIPYFSARETGHENPKAVTAKTFQLSEANSKFLQNFDEMQNKRAGLIF